MRSKPRGNGPSLSQETGSREKLVVLAVLDYAIARKKSYTAALHRPAPEASFSSSAGTVGAD